MFKIKIKDDEKVVAKGRGDLEDIENIFNTIKKKYQGGLK